MAGRICTSPTIRTPVRCTSTTRTGHSRTWAWPLAGMGVAAGDYDRNGTIDLFKTNFAGDTSTLYANDGKGLCEDRTFSAGIGLNTRRLRWGVRLVELAHE